ncbi:hypothetical protein FRC11_001876, partial [Ceratobasidium sp. 423]
DTLMIGFESFHEDAPRVCSLLELMPTIKTLYLDRWPLSTDTLSPSINHAGPTSEGEHRYSRLTKLYIGRSSLMDISSLDTLKKLVSSHPIMELGLGIGFQDAGCCYHDLQYPHHELDPYREWLLEAAPKAV